MKPGEDQVATASVEDPIMGILTRSVTNNLSMKTVEKQVNVVVGKLTTLMLVVLTLHQIARSFAVNATPEQELTEEHNF